MASHKDNINRIETVAEGLKELVDELIFIGGACIQFYVSNPSLRDYRQTKDVDSIVKIYSYSEFACYSERLRELGFKNDTSEGAPIARWVFNGILVDIIPDESSIVGCRETPWFKEGRKYATKKQLPSGKIIKILSLPYFFATKLEASKNRGNGDFFSDHDIEDIINVIDGNDNLTEILIAPKSVKNYVVKSFTEMLNDEDFRRSISGHIGFESSASERAKDVANKIAAIIHRFGKSHK